GILKKACARRMPPSPYMLIGSSSPNVSSKLFNHPCLPQIAIRLSATTSAGNPMGSAISRRIHRRPGSFGRRAIASATGTASPTERSVERLACFSVNCSTLQVYGEYVLAPEKPGPKPSSAIIAKQTNRNIDPHATAPNAMDLCLCPDVSIAEYYRSLIAVSHSSIHD